MVERLRKLPFLLLLCMLVGFLLPVPKKVPPIIPGSRPPWYETLWPQSNNQDGFGAWRRFPSQEGEVLTYEVRAFLGRVGTATTTTGAPIVFEPRWETPMGQEEPYYGHKDVAFDGTLNRPTLEQWPRMVYPISVSTTGGIAWYKVEHSITSFIDANGTFSWRYDKYAREGGSVKTENLEIDQRTGFAYYFKKREEETELSLRNTASQAVPLAQDPLSCLYFVRCAPLALGRTLNVRVHTGKQNWDTLIHVVDEVVLEIPAGTFHAWVLKPEFDYEGLFSRDSDPTVWVERTTHIPLQMQVTIKGFNVTTRLISYEGVPEWE